MHDLVFNRDSTLPCTLLPAGSAENRDSSCLSLSLSLSPALSNSTRQDSSSPSLCDSLSLAYDLYFTSFQLKQEITARHIQLAQKKNRRRKGRDGCGFCRLEDRCSL